MEQLTLIPVPNRIVPHEEGIAKLRAIREAVAGEQPAPCSPLHAPLAGQAESPACVSGGAVHMRHDLDRMTLRCTRCGWQARPFQ